MTINSQSADFTDSERARSSLTFDATYQTIGTPLTKNPIIVIIDNQSDVYVGLSTTGTNTWKTFSPGEALILDMRANHGIASTFTADIGTQFYVISGVGTSGSFRISVINAK